MYLLVIHHKELEVLLYLAVVLFYVQEFAVTSTRQSVDLCLVCVGASQLETGQAGTVALVL